MPESQIQILTNPRDVFLWHESSSSPWEHRPHAETGYVTPVTVLWTFAPFDWTVDLCSAVTKYMSKHTHAHAQTWSCVPAHVPQQALNKQTVSIQRSPKKWKHITNAEADMQGPSETGKRCFGASTKTRLEQKTSLLWLPYWQGTFARVTLNALSVRKKPIPRCFHGVSLS